MPTQACQIRARSSWEPRGTVDITPVHSQVPSAFRGRSEGEPLLGDPSFPKLRASEMREPCRLQPLENGSDLAAHYLVLNSTFPVLMRKFPFE